MRKLLKNVMGGVALALMLGGCGMSGDDGQQKMDRQETETGQEGAETVSVTDIRKLQELAQRDNSLDAYSAVRHAFLPSERPEGELMETFFNVALGENSAACYARYIPMNPEEQRDEFAMVTTEGDEGLIDLTGNKRYSGMGTALGKDQYFLYGGSDGAYSIYEVDGGMQLLKELQLDFLGSSGTEYEYIEQLMADTDGCLHAVIGKAQLEEAEDGTRYFIGETSRYCMISAEGELLAEYALTDAASKLVPLYDGRVALATGQTDRGRLLMQCMDAETGRLTDVLDCEAELVKRNYYYTLMDEETLAYADVKGIWRRSLSGGEPELLYQWMNHGVTVSSVLVMQAREDRISLIYRCEKGLGYLCIEPTTEEVELREITITVPSYREDIYRAAVVEFNRRYPTCHINMKSYDRDALLTELSAGKGPVLIDTQMTGFADKEEMWEPIEKVLRQLGVMDNLVDKAMDQGRINGTLYGIVMDFYLETVVTADMELTDWDYDSFLRLLSEREDLKAVMNSYAGDDGWYFILQFFIQDMEDNYLLDAETATTHFDSEEFRTILHFAKDYCERKDFVDAVEGLEDGQVFCNVITIARPDQLALYRLAYGDRVNYIGFPSGNGAKTVINCVEPMVMRKNATKEEKELAYAFLEILLSEEIQSEAANDLNYKLSSRKDVLAEQLANVSEDDLPNAPGFEPITLNGAIDYEKDAELLYRLLEKAEPKTGFPRELYQLIIGEILGYFDGTVTEDMVIQNLTNRVGLYLEEQK